MELEQLIEPVSALARQAGDAILAVYATDFAVQSKDDDSPLTQADLASHRVIMAGLAELTPALPIISEESGLPEFAERQGWKEYWLIDPLDGTKEFVKRNGEFTVNIALIRESRPVLGVVHVPVLDKTYTGCEGRGAARSQGGDEPRPIRVRASASTPIRVVGSRSHQSDSVAAFLEAAGDTEMVPMGSSLKFCVVAEGGADVYPRLGPTSEWDTAAAQAVVEQAGGHVLKTNGGALDYNTKADILNPWFVVIGPADRDWLAMVPDAG